MAKTKVSQWDSVAANNTDINSININEGCPPSTINNAIRETMAQIKDWQDGSSGDGWTSSGTITSSGTLAVTGNLTFDGAAGASGTYLKSTGSGNTPVWSNLGLGTMSTQNSNAVNITGGSITGLSALTTSGGTITASAITAATVTSSTTLAIGSDWTVIQSGSTLIFKFAGTSKMKVDSSGNLTVVGNVTAFGTI